MKPPPEQLDWGRDEDAEELTREEMGGHGQPLQCGIGADHRCSEAIYLEGLGATKLWRARIWIAGRETTTLS